MSQELIALEINGVTGEVTERPLTPEEIAKREVMQAEAEAQQAEVEAKVAARESAAQKLSSILNPEEIAALFG
jgi:hypothetical protein